MKIIASCAVIAIATVGCEPAPSKLDHMRAVAPTSESGATRPAPVKIDHSGTLEERVARLEDYYAHNAEALDFLGKVYAQQQQQQQAQEREEPAPDAVFAV